MTDDRRVYAEPPTAEEHSMIKVWDYPEIVKEMKRKYRSARVQLAMDYQIPLDVSEMAVVFQMPHDLRSFVKWAVLDQAAVNFNTTEDWMVRADADGKFRVRFAFLQFPGDPFRVEAMCVLSGDAPLHRTQIWHHGSGSVVHASFKLPDEAAYESLLEGSKEKKRLGLSDFRAEYRNTYGRFFYLQGALNYYLKPRVNLRDETV